MSEIIISIKNISKNFRRYHHPADRLKELLLPGKSYAQEFWALKNISLEIPRGHTLGIVGKNGSGKSTLLQIIAGTLRPTTGEVKVQGKVAALLELGSGFNPEFTGRQNVFFNGRLLGLTQTELESKFEAIWDFSEIGDFIDQPVKTYSSGMFVRLAFAVATSINPDILVVDEALSVGDEAFQRKCYARIQDIQAQGGTVLFVSHSASTVTEFCDSAVLLDHGELLLQGSSKLVISQYHNLIYAAATQTESVRQSIRQLNQTASLQTPLNLDEDALTTNQIIESELEQLSVTASVTKPTHSMGGLKSGEAYIPGLVPKSTVYYDSHGAIIESPGLTTLSGEPVNFLIRREKYIYTYTVKFNEPATDVCFGMLIKTVSGLSLGGASSHPPLKGIVCVEAGTIFKVSFTFQCLLQPGVYFLNAGVHARKNDRYIFLHRLIDAAMFRVQPLSDLCATESVDFLIEPAIEQLETHFAETT